MKRGYKIKKKILLSTILVSSLLLATSCENTKANNGDPEKISYTNKYICTRTETSNTSQVYYLTKEEVLNESDAGKQAVEISFSRSYDFNKAGDKLLAYYDITTYKFLVDYNMESLKKYYENDCKNKDQKTYKTCEVSLKDKVITVVSEVDLNSEESKEYLSTATLEAIKENYASSPYKCQ